MILEACVVTLEEAVHAEKCGADQVELCADLKYGGLTPSIDLVRTVVKKLCIPVKVMIRPRAGNFVYSGDELRCMENSIELFKQEGLGGMVLGILKESGEVDVVKSSMLIRKAGSLPITFHRAVDETPDPLRAVGNIIATGASFILTSGQAHRAIQGAEVIRQMLERAGKDLTIIAAVGITVHNLAFAKEIIGAQAFHGTGIVGRPDQGIPWRTI